MKQQVFYLHGGESFSNYEDFLTRIRTKDIWDLPGTSSKKKWTATFAEDLGEDFEVFMPRMPNAQNAKYQEWSIWFERHFEHLRDGVILMGCSLGAMFLYKYAIENTFPFTVRALVLLASPAEDSDFDDRDCGDFAFPLEKVATVQDKVEKVVVMHSEDDFLVPYHHAEILKGHLPDAELVTFTDKGHFLVEEFPELVERIRKEKD